MVMSKPETDSRSISPLENASKTSKSRGRIPAGYVTERFATDCAVFCRRKFFSGFDITIIYHSWSGYYTAVLTAFLLSPTLF
ncbi:MAG: hypothetical protein IJB34_01525 [Clostridia bacterium]|nr:hypothetical protein [Clostridia bacterium]